MHCGCRVVVLLEHPFIYQYLYTNKFYPQDNDKSLSYENTHVLVLVCLHIHVLVLICLHTFVLVVVCLHTHVLIVDYLHTHVLVVDYLHTHVLVVDCLHLNVLVCLDYVTNIDSV